MNIHIQTWSGSCAASITEMRNAGKRGKTCRVLRFQGRAPHGTSEMARDSGNATRDVLRFLDSCLGDEPFDEIHAAVERMISAFALPDHCLSVTTGTIRGIDAPRLKLSAGVPGKWSASADETGVTVDNLRDTWNQPCCITPHSQTKHAAYTKAAKAWNDVERAKTFGEACDVLTAAGCRLHRFCRMD